MVTRLVESKAELGCARPGAGERGTGEGGATTRRSRSELVAVSVGFGVGSLRLLRRLVAGR